MLPTSNPVVSRQSTRKPGRPEIGRRNRLLTELILLTLTAFCAVGVSSAQTRRSHTGAGTSSSTTTSDANSSSTSSGSPANILSANFMSAADTACPPVYSSDGLTCQTQPPNGTWFAVTASKAGYATGSQ